MMPWWWIYFREHLSIASFPKKTKYNTVQITYFLIKFADKTVSLKYRSSIFVNMGIVLMRMVNKPSPPTKHIHHSVAFANTAAWWYGKSAHPIPRSLWGSGWPSLCLRVLFSLTMRPRKIYPIHNGFILYFYHTFNFYHSKTMASHVPHAPPRPHSLSILSSIPNACFWLVVVYTK